MKLSDLLDNRDKLRRYDEFMAWKENFSKDELYLNSTCALFGPDEVLAVFIPETIRGIILSALEAEIAKLDAE